MTSFFSLRKKHKTQLFKYQEVSLFILSSAWILNLGNFKQKIKQKQLNFVPRLLNESLVIIEGGPTLVVSEKKTLKS